MMTTVYVVFDRQSGLPVGAGVGEVEEVMAPYVTWGPHGDLYACRVSPSIADEVLGKVLVKPEYVSSILKTYSHSMTKCGDV